jgi:hypothetical protein
VSLPLTLTDGPTLRRYIAILVRVSQLMLKAEKEVAPASTENSGAQRTKPESSPPRGADHGVTGDVARIFERACRSAEKRLELTDPGARRHDRACATASTAVRQVIKTRDGEYHRISGVLISGTAPESESVNGKPQVDDPDG